VEATEAAPFPASEAGFGDYLGKLLELEELLECRTLDQEKERLLDILQVFSSTVTAHLSALDIVVSPSQPPKVPAGRRDVPARLPSTSACLHAFRSCGGQLIFSKSTGATGYLGPLAR
jgi:hypothetical protein